jgi:hypothetical protein
MNLIATYETAQTDLAIITPSSGKKVYLWQVVLTAEDGVELNFLTSVLQVAKIEKNGSVGIMNPDKNGAIDEVLSLTCGANATVKILYDEIS